MTDTNGAIHQYRMRSSLQPDIKHIPKTLLGALQESDIPMTDDELCSVSLRMSDRNMSKKQQQQQQQPPTQQEQPSKSDTIQPAPAANTIAASNALASAFTNSNPLDNMHPPQHKQEKAATKPINTSSSSSMSWVVILIVVLVGITLLGCGIYFYK